MAKDLNSCFFIGRIGKPLELKYMPNGNAVLNFSIACSDDYKDKGGEKVEQTNWIDLVIFGKGAEIVKQYCSKGSKLFVNGKQRTRKWQTESGENRYSTEVVVNDFQMLDSKGDNQHQSQQSAPRQNTSSGHAGFDDDIPF